MTVDDWPRRALGRPVSAYVVVTYDLDGSGSARNATVSDSHPNTTFDRTTLSLLERTSFAQGVVAQGCINVRTYGAVRRAEG
ncbi:energy transducer TonB family protein [Marilutibacter penaei]